MGAPEEDIAEGANGPYGSSISRVIDLLREDIISLRAAGR